MERTARNTLRLVVRSAPVRLTPVRELPGTLDIGEGGRLLGMELELESSPVLGTPWRDSPAAPDAPQFDPRTAVFYLPIAPATGRHARSATVSVRIFTGDDGGLVAVEIPRRGTGYEIAYPSGTQ